MKTITSVLSSTSAYASTLKERLESSWRCSECGYEAWIASNQAR